MSLVQKEEDNTDSNTETDLFGRSKGEEVEGLSTIFDFIENAAIKLQYTNNTGMVLSLVIKVFLKQHYFHNKLDNA